MANLPDVKLWTRREIYEIIYTRMCFAMNIHNIPLSEGGKSQELISRKANIYAVQTTDYWFHHQDEVNEW